MVVALLQPAPETYDLFDDVILMSDARIVYHGLLHEVGPFFKSMGFAPTLRKAMPDFLQEVTSKVDQRVRSVIVISIFCVLLCDSNHMVHSQLEQWFDWV